MQLKQTKAFLDYEGNNWFNRNFMKIEDNKHKDRLVTLLKLFSIKPTHVVEFGCANGWQLEELRKAFDAVCVGLDPSEDAIKTGRIRYPDLRLDVGDARIYRYCGDLVIAGFFLYLCDRKDLFAIVENLDRSLENGGHLVIHDFDPDHPHCVPYHHLDGMYSYKMDYSKLWLANPAYRLVSKTRLDDGQAIWILKKDMEAAWPIEKHK